MNIKEFKVKFTERTVAFVALDVAWSLYKDYSEYMEQPLKSKKQFEKCIEPDLKQLMADIYPYLKNAFGERFIKDAYKEEDCVEITDIDLSFLDNIKI